MKNLHFRSVRLHFCKDGPARGHRRSIRLPEMFRQPAQRAGDILPGLAAEGTAGFLAENRTFALRLMEVADEKENSTTCIGAL